jgi:hypothetical protein
MDSNIFDKRVVRRNIEKGVISQQDYLKYLNELEDNAGNCDVVEEELYPRDEPKSENDEASGDPLMSKFS